MLINGADEIIKNSLQTRERVCVSFIIWLILTDQLSVDLWCEFLAVKGKEEWARELFKPCLITAHLKSTQSH